LALVPKSVITPPKIGLGPKQGPGMGGRTCRMQANGKYCQCYRANQFHDAPENCCGHRMLAKRVILV
jgi:hypothetical protein